MKRKTHIHIYVLDRTLEYFQEHSGIGQNKARGAVLTLTSQHREVLRIDLMWYILKYKSPITIFFNLMIKEAPQASHGHFINALKRGDNHNGRQSDKPPIDKRGLPNEHSEIMHHLAKPNDEEAFRCCEPPMTT